MPAVPRIFADYLEIPPVLEPICVSASARCLMDGTWLNAELLLPFPAYLVVTPNSVDDRLLAPEAKAPAAVVKQILTYGRGAVLLTRSDERTQKVVNCPYPYIRLTDYVTFERLEISCHGSGCTLASAIAARIAHGREPVEAVSRAQNCSFEPLNNARKLGKGQFLPRRRNWARGLRSAN